VLALYSRIILIRINVKSITYKILAVACALSLSGCNFIPFLGGDAASEANRVSLPGGDSNLPQPGEGLENSTFGPATGLRNPDGCLVAKAAEFAYGYLFVSAIQAGEYEIPIQESINILRLQSRLNELMQAPNGRFSQVLLLVDGGTVTYSDGTSSALEVSNDLELNFNPPISLYDQGLPKFCILDQIERQEDGSSLLAPGKFFFRGH